MLHLQHHIRITLCYPLITLLQNVPAGVAEERILLVVVDRAAFVTLIHVLAAVAANAGVRRNGGAGTKTLRK